MILVVLGMGRGKPTKGKNKEKKTKSNKKEKNQKKKSTVVSTVEPSGASHSAMPKTTARTK